MRHMLSHRRTVAAFTLIEILVIALLISILSAIALFSVRSMMDRARVRTVIGETYQISTALSLCRDDIGIYPKMNFLLGSINEIGEFTGAITPTNRIHPDFECFGNDIDNQTTRLASQWNGPYMGMSQTRTTAGIAAGPSIVRMQLPQANNQEVFFPGDAWQQPYTLYLMSIDGDGLVTFNTGESGLPFEVENFTTLPNFFSAVVSYGPNKQPGGQDLSNLPATFDPEEARLYETINPRNPFIYRALVRNQYNTENRINGYFAIQDENSDDLVREF
jgi:type II secretory pathway pseudopilin PulG